MCISNGFPGEAAMAGLGTTLGELLVNTGREGGQAKLFHNTHYICNSLLNCISPPTFQECSDLVCVVDNCVPSAKHKLGAQRLFVNESDLTPVLVNGPSLSHKNIWPCHKAVSYYYMVFSWEVHRLQIVKLHRAPPPNLQPLFMGTIAPGWSFPVRPARGENWKKVRGAEGDIHLLKQSRRRVRVVLPAPSPW